MFFETKERMMLFDINPFRWQCVLDNFITDKENHWNDKNVVLHRDAKNTRAGTAEQLERCKENENKKNKQTNTYA